METAGARTDASVGLAGHRDVFEHLRSLRQQVHAVQNLSVSFLELVVLAVIKSVHQSRILKYKKMYMYIFV